MCNLNYSPIDLHQHLVHEFYHGLAKTIIPMFFVIFGHYQKFKQWSQGFIVQHWTTLLQQMKHNGKLNNFMNFFSYHPMCQLGINSLSARRCKCFCILGMLTNFGVKQISFFSHQTPCSSQLSNNLHAQKKNITQQQIFCFSLLPQYKPCI